MTEISLPTEYFTKRAKALKKQVLAAEPGACARVRNVFADAKNKPDGELATDFGQMRALHVVAVEHGFESWEALSKASPVEARLAITMQSHPELNDFGVGLFYADYKKSKSEQQAIYEANRRALHKSAAAVETTVTWLRENIEPTKTVNKRQTSYGIKHVADKDIGYITNGVFIAAGIIAGYPYEIVPGSPNVPFGMSEKSLREVSLRRSSPERVLKRYIPTAVAILAKRGIQAYPVGREGVELAWLDDGDVRTLKIEAIEKSPFIVRLYVDHYTLFISQKLAKALGVSDKFTRYYAQAIPVRGKAEISVVMDEVEPALEWALNYNARTGSSPPTPPFEVAAPRRPSAEDRWSYLWSKRAGERNRAAETQRAGRRAAS